MAQPLGSASQFSENDLISVSQNGNNAPFYDLTKVSTTSAATPTQTTGEVPFWGDSPGQWDTVVFNGSIALPGICKVSGRVVRRVDRKKSPGKHGQTVTYLGDEAAEFEIHLQMWTAEHLDSYVNIVRKLKTLKPKTQAQGIDSRKKISATILTMSHPALAIFKISLAHVLEYSLPEADGDSGSFKATLKCLQYIPPNIAKNGGTNTPGAGKGTGAGNLETGLQNVIDPKTKWPSDKANKNKPSLTSSGPNPPEQLASFAP